MSPARSLILALALAATFSAWAQEPDSPYASTRALLRSLSRQTAVVLRQSRGEAIYHVIRTGDAVLKAGFALEAVQFAAISHAQATTAQERRRAEEFIDSAIEELTVAYNTAESPAEARLPVIERQLQADGKAAIGSAGRFAAAVRARLKARPSP